MTEQEAEATQSIWGDLDVESAADDPFAVPNNTYRAILTDAKVGPTKAGDKVGLTPLGQSTVRMSTTESSSRNGSTFRSQSILRI